MTAQLFQNMYADQPTNNKNIYLYQPMEQANKTTSLSDAQRYEQVFNQLYEPLVRYAQTMVHDLAEAEDITQSVFLALWKDKAKVDIGGEIKSYLYKGVYFKCLNTLNRDKVKQKYENITSNASPIQHTDVLVSKELEQTIQETMDALPEQCRKIFAMNRFEKKKYREIAEELSLSVKTVENQISKALSIFRVSLADFLYFIIITQLVL